MRRLFCVLLATFCFISPAHATWREASSKHFVIYSEQSAKSLQEFAESLERFDKGLRLLFGVADDQTSHASKVTIFVVPDIPSVRRLMGRKAPSGVAGFYIDHPEGPAAFVPRGTGDGESYGFDSRLVLQHEYAHHFLMQNFTGVFPPWLNEGFAEFASTAELQRDGSLNLGMAANHRAYGLLFESGIPIEQLLVPPTGKAETAERMDRFYGRSWLVCHYLIVDPARRGQLSAYMQRVNSGTPSLDAAKAAFGDLQAFNKDVNGYLRKIQSKMAGYRLKPEMLPIESVRLRDVGPGEAAIMQVRIQSKAGVSEPEAKTIVALARKAAAPFPNDPAVQTALAEAEFDAGNYAEAKAAAERAIAADPKAVDALTYKGAAQMELVALKTNDTPAEWSEIRKALIAANRLDPEDPEPLTLFFMSFLRQGLAPTPNAVEAAKRALELAPQNTGLRMTVAHYMLRHGKAAEAKGALMRLAALPHDAGLATAAAKAIAALDQGGTDAALAVLNGRDEDAAQDGQAES